ncbi:MAG: hypothetical protein ABR571_18160 [Jatrophihabitans sp.]|uniref:hypothetical protein n=1 Tax=Jatrophihabitans sp. TaxID=1932789 RepID=UPI00391200FD
MPTQITDDVLVGGRRGDAFAVIWRELSPVVAGYLAARGVDDPKAVTSDVFLSLLPGGRTVGSGALGALSDLLVSGLARDVLARRHNRSRIVVGMLLAGGTTLGLSGVAAAHDALPGPAQSVVVDVVNEFTPFHIADNASPVPAPTDTAPPRRTSGSGGESGSGGGSGSTGGGSGGGSGEGSGGSGSG